MIEIQVLNNISPYGIEVLENKGCKVGKDSADPHGILVRSADMLHMKFGKNLLGISRAGAGVNNIPVEHCAEEGIPCPQPRDTQTADLERESVGYGMAMGMGF